MKDSAHTPANSDRTDPVERETTPTRNGQDRHVSENARSKSVRHRERRRVLSAIGLQVFFLVCMIFISLLAALAHGYDWPIPSAEDFASFDFIGVGPDNPEPTFLAVAIEVLFWSAFGVLARSEYHVTRLVIERRDFETLETISKLIGDFARAIAIAIAVVALLRSTEFVTLSLKDAGIDVVAAISFILGFYHEDTHRLLGTFRESVAKGTSKEVEDRETV